jgi:hypothetical protein
LDDPQPSISVIKIDLSKQINQENMEMATSLLEAQRQDIKETKTLGKLSKEKIEEILQKCIINESSCWLWQGRIGDNKKGHQHGLVWFKGNWRHVHRLMYHNFVKDVPEYESKSGMLQVNHKCSHEQNGRCINPAHLYLGTPRDNMQDALRDGTKAKAPKGEDNYNATVSNEAVNKALALQNSALTQKEIATIIGVNQSQISRWFNKKTRCLD